MRTPGRQSRTAAAGLAATRERTQVSRRSCRLKRNGKREGGAWSIIGLGPKTTLMSLDDRAADKQPDAHTTALRGVEGIEQRVPALRRGAHARIAEGQTLRLGVLPVG